MRTVIFLAGFAVGMGIFLLGLKIMSTALEDVLGFRLKMLLTRLTATKGRSVIAGLVSTCLVQSSSAVAASMVVLVDGGILNLSQAFAIILGANIGTTLTAQIIVFRLEHAALPLIACGIILNCLRGTRSAGKTVFGLGSIFFGLAIVTSTLTPILKFPLVHEAVIQLTDSPLEACLFGVVLTVLVQSSSAVTGLVVGLVRLNLVSLSSAVGLALGSNIGTVITTLFASVGRSRESKATAYADLFFNLGGVLFVLPLYPWFLRIVRRLAVDPARQVAHAHTVFNIITALFALPFLDYLIRLAWWWAGIGGATKNNKHD